MSRCKCCDTELSGRVRYKTGELFDGLFIEEDMCNTCIYYSEFLQYSDVKEYQFEEDTESLYRILNLIV